MEEEEEDDDDMGGGRHSTQTRANAFDTTQLDPRRAKRILANRQSAQRSRMKRLQVRGCFLSRIEAMHMLDGMPIETAHMLDGMVIKGTLLF
jgi:hypothetical protein